jgi:hypothetical protein
MSKAKHYRKISTCIWNDAKFMALSLDAKLIIFFLLTHPTLTQLGAIRGNVPGFAYELGMELKAFEKAFQEVLAQGIAKHDGALLVWFPNFLKYNIPESPNVIKSWRGGFDALPESTLKVDMLESAKATVDGLHKAFKKAFAEAFTETGLLPSANQRTENKEQKEEVREGTNVPLSAGADVSVVSPDEIEPSLLEPEQAPKADPCQQVADLYNRLLVDDQPNGHKLPRCTAVTDRRKTAIRARSKAEFKTLDDWEEYFRRVGRCPYLMGEVNEWKASFDWLLNVSNCLKVREGNFLPSAEKKASKKLPALSQAVDFVSRYVSAGEDFAAMVAVFCENNRLDRETYEPAIAAAIKA